MSYQFTAPGEARSWEKIRTLAKECVKSSQGERPEVRRLKNIYEELRKAKGLSRAGMDALIYQRIYGKEPERTSSTLKIRYWRTGHHVPVNRDTALAFARALELPSRDASWFLTAWLDKSLEFYPEAPPRQDLLYWQRRRRLEDLAFGYLTRMSERPPTHLNGIRLLESRTSERDPPAGGRPLKQSAPSLLCRRPAVYLPGALLFFLGKAYLQHPL